MHCTAAPVALIKRRKVATKSNFGGKDDVNKILTEPFFGTCVLPDGKSRGLNVFRMTLIYHWNTFLALEKNHLRKDSRREKQWDKNNFPSSRFARWPGQRQALFVQTGKI